MGTIQADAVVVTLAGLLGSAVSTGAVAAPEPVPVTWDYLVVTDLDKLKETLPDPTSACHPAERIAVLGHQGWELVQFFETNPSNVSVKGAMRPDASYQSTHQEDIQLGGQSLPGHLSAIFKRPRPFPDLHQADCSKK